MMGCSDSRRFFFVSYSVSSMLSALPTFWSTACVMRRLVVMNLDTNRGTNKATVSHSLGKQWWRRKLKLCTAPHTLAQAQTQLFLSHTHAATPAAAQHGCRLRAGCRIAARRDHRTRQKRLGSGTTAMNNVRFAERHGDREMCDLRSQRRRGRHREQAHAHATGKPSAFALGFRVRWSTQVAIFFDLSAMIRCRSAVNEGNLFHPPPGLMYCFPLSERAFS